MCICMSISLATLWKLAVIISGLSNGRLITQNRISQSRYDERVLIIYVKGEYTFDSLEIALEIE